MIILNRKRLFFACLFAAVTLLMAGYAQVSIWLAVPILATFILSGWIATRFRPRRFGPPWIPSILLALYMTAAAGGALLGISPAAMIAGSALMLACWELSGQVDSRPGAAVHPLDGLFERVHLQLLAISVGLGLLLAEGGLLIHFSLPFGVTFLAGLLILFSLYQFSRLFGE